MINENNNSCATGSKRGKIKEPGLYRVVLHNDDFTPMEFVTGLLEKIFYFERRQAVQMMMEIHQKGMAACGWFSKDVAETKVFLVTEYAEQNEHPLLCRMEPA